MDPVGGEGSEELVPVVTDLAKVPSHEPTATPKIGESLLTAAHLALLHTIVTPVCGGSFGAVLLR